MPGEYTVAAVAAPAAVVLLELAVLCARRLGFFVATAANEA